VTVDKYTAAKLNRLLRGLLEREVLADAPLNQWREATLRPGRSTPPWGMPLEVVPVPVEVEVAVPA
jgi:hypothetical protein